MPYGIDLYDIATKGMAPPRHLPDVNPLLSVIVALAGLAVTDRLLDRIAIATTIAANNLDSGSGEPWSEVTRPTVVIYFIRFVPPDTALVDGAMKQYGSAIIVRRVPVRILLRKRSGQWRITSVMGSGGG